jgi:hypothetical protein
LPAVRNWPISTGNWQASKANSSRRS